MVFTDEQKKILQEFYRSCRLLVSSGVSSAYFTQRSFEDAIAGVRMEESWRPTHISRLAAVEVAEGRRLNVQRAHGVLFGRIERNERTLRLLTEPERPFDEWWEFFCEHDSTLLVTRKEHSGKTPLSPMIELPDPALGMFLSRGFKVKLRQTVEVKWIREQLLAVEID